MLQPLAIGDNLSFLPSLFGVNAAGIAIQFSGELHAFTLMLASTFVTQLLVSVILTTTVFAMVAFLFGASVRLYQQCYKGKPDVEIQSSTKYTPEYK